MHKGARANTAEHLQTADTNLHKKKLLLMFVSRAALLSAHHAGLSIHIYTSSLRHYELNWFITVINVPDSHTTVPVLNYMM